MGPHSDPKQACIWELGEPCPHLNLECPFQALEFCSGARYVAVADRRRQSAPRQVAHRCSEYLGAAGQVPCVT